MTILEIDPRPRRLGKTDLAVGPLGFGLWRFAGAAPAEARRPVEAALEAGMTLLDTADIYGGEGASEALLGRVFAESPALRERVVLATKCGIVPGVPYDSSAAHVRGSCEASLRRLGAERIDLYQIHRPDWLAHPEEVAGALASLRQAGKVREVGVSNYTPSQFEALQAFLPFPLATHQPELNLLRRAALEDGVLDQCLRHGVTPLAWSPLAGGVLALPADAAAAPPGGAAAAAAVRALDRIAAAQDVPRSAVALAWLLVHPAGVIPLVGTQRPERLREATAALRVRLTRRDWYDLVVAARGERLP